MERRITKIANDILLHSLWYTEHVIRYHDNSPSLPLPFSSPSPPLPLSFPLLPPPPSSLSPPSPGGANDIAFSPYNRMLMASVGQDSIICLYDLIQRK